MLFTFHLKVVPLPSTNIAVALNERGKQTYSEEHTHCLCPVDNHHRAGPAVFALCACRAWRIGLRPIQRGGCNRHYVFLHHKCALQHDHPLHQLRAGKARRQRQPHLQHEPCHSYCFCDYCLDTTGVGRHLLHPELPECRSRKGGRRNVRLSGFHRRHLPKPDQRPLQQPVHRL